MNGPQHYRKAEELLAQAEAGFTYIGDLTERAATSREAQEQLEDALQGVPLLSAVVDSAKAHAELAKVACMAESTQSAMHTASPRWREIITKGEQESADASS